MSLPQFAACGLTEEELTRLVHKVDAVETEAKSQMTSLQNRLNILQETRTNFLHSNILRWDAEPHYNGTWDEFAEDIDQMRAYDEELQKLRASIHLLRDRRVAADSVDRTVRVFCSLAAQAVTAEEDGERDYGFADALAAKLAQHWHVSMLNASGLDESELRATGYPLQDSDDDDMQ